MVYCRGDVDREAARIAYRTGSFESIEVDQNIISMKPHATPMKYIETLMLWTLVLSYPLELVASSEEKPNIIFLMTDDQRWDNFGCYGKPEFQTHNIDRLAEQGVIFDNAYYTVAICKPSRVTMFTGRYFANHRVGFTAPFDYTLSHDGLADSYPAQLKKVGYRTGFVGKVGFAVTEEAERPGTPEGYDFEKHFKSTFDFFVGDGTHSGGPSKTWPADDPVLKEIYREGRQNTGRTLKTGESVLRFLDTQPKDQPFCLSVSFLATKHDKDADMYMPHYELFKDYEFEAPENWVEGANEDLPQVIKDHARGFRLHMQRSSTRELYLRQVRRFATQGYTVDQQVGLMMAKLEEMGVLDNTIVIYTSDNGRFQGSHGLYDKCILYDESMKAPLIVFDGRVPEEQRGRRESALISSVDIAPTILSLAGLDIPESMQGRDFRSVITQTQDMSQWRDAVFMENLFIASLYNVRNEPNAMDLNQQMIAENESYRTRGVRTERWKYFVYYEHTPPVEELYDMENDPQELNNLINDPEYAEVLKRLRKKTEEMYLDAVQ